MESNGIATSGIALRAAEPADRAFVESVYFETQRRIIERLFGLRCYEVERQKFDGVYDERAARVICYEGAPIGWLSTTINDEAVEVGHIYLSPEFQNRGIGTFLILNIIEDAHAKKLKVRLSTAKINPAIELYKRLGFKQVDESEFKTHMELR